MVCFHTLLIPGLVETSRPTGRSCSTSRCFHTLLIPGLIATSKTNQGRNGLWRFSYPSNFGSSCNMVEKNRTPPRCCRFHTLLISGLVATIADRAIGSADGGDEFSYPSDSGSSCNDKKWNGNQVPLRGFHTLLIPGLVATLGLGRWHALLPGFHTLPIPGLVATVRFFVLNTFCFVLQPRIFKVISLTHPDTQGLLRSAQLRGGFKKLSI